MSDKQFADRFERDFNKRIPRKIAESFTDEQRAAIRTAFGGESWDGHAVDLRGRIPVLRWYFAFVAGRDKRTSRRQGLDDRPKSNVLGRIFGALTMMIVLALFATLLVLL